MRLPGPLIARLNVNWRTDNLRRFAQIYRMETPPEPRIADVQRMNGGIFISFSDGRNVFYSADLLYTIIPQAREVNVSEDDD
jgi:hypothetical protein